MSTRQQGAVLSYSSLRNPTLQVLANGLPLQNVLEVDIFDNAHFAAARFRLRLALSPAAVTSALQPGTLLDIRISLGGVPVSLIQGEPDSIGIDALNQTADVEGRDLTARLLDARTQETFSNQTASEIANTLAGRHSLTPVVAATSTLAGRYYGNEHDRISLGQFSRAMTEWDLLTFLAAQEGFNVYVSGTSLYFGPPSTGAPTYNLLPDACMSLQLEHTLTLARDIEVTVKSWNTRQQLAFSQAASRGTSGQVGGAPQKIVVVRPNLSPNDALQLAQRILADLSAHERVVTVEIPGELSLSPRTQVALTGTGTDFDQTYYVAELDRHFSSDRGFTERLRLKNTTTAGIKNTSASAATS